MNKNQQQNNSDIFLTAKELSKRWKGAISIPVLANWRSQNKGPAFIKLGSKVMYRLSDVKSYEDNKKNLS